jgi:hypothetical protein
MKRNRIAFAALGIAAPLLLAGCGGLADASYTAVRDGAQSALSVTFSFSADLANWLEETPEPQEPPCDLGLRG